MALQPQTMAQAAQPGAEMAQPQQAGQQEDGNKQAMFEQLAGPKLEYIYGDGLDDVKGVLEAGADNPAMAIGDLVGKLLASSAMNARDNGVSVPPDVMTATALELTNNVADIAVNMGLLGQDEASEAAEESFVTAIGTFGQIAVGNAIGEQEKQAYAKIVSEMEQLMSMKGASPEPQEQAPTEQPQAEAQAPQTMAQAM